jgi:hypothetical protein
MLDKKFIFNLSYDEMGVPVSKKLVYVNEEGYFENLDLYLNVIEQNVIKNDLMIVEMSDCTVSDVSLTCNQTYQYVITRNENTSELRERVIHTIDTYKTVFKGDFKIAVKHLMDSIYNNINKSSKKSFLRVVK